MLFSDVHIIMNHVQKRVGLKNMCVLKESHLLATASTSKSHNGETLFMVSFVGCI